MSPSNGRRARLERLMKKPESSMSRSMRFGQFQLPRKTRDNAPLREIRKVMSHFIVVRAFDTEDGERTHYVAYSELFRSIKATDPVPAYELQISTGQNGALFVHVSEIRAHGGALQEMKDALEAAHDDAGVQRYNGDDGQEASDDDAGRVLEPGEARAGA